MPDQTQQTDQTHAKDAGHTTSEFFFTKVLVYSGIVISIAGFVGDVISQVSGLIPQGSNALKIMGVVGAVMAGVSKIAYVASRTIVKAKLADAEVAAEIAPTKTPDEAAAIALGTDAPGGGSKS